MLRTIVLICAASTSPADCTPETAIDVVRPFTLQGAMCGVGSVGAVATLAGSPIRPELGKSYPKIVCERSGKTG